MNSLSFKTFLLLTSLIVTPLFSKKPRPPKPPKHPLTQEQKQIIASNIAQVMGGICTIAQDPHNPHNIGNSVASMIHGLINIAVEKISHKKINRHTSESLEEYLEELCQEISAEITEIVIANKKLLRPDLSL